MTTTHEMTPIGTVHSCFPDKFGVPRQPTLCPNARGRIALTPPWDDPDCFRGLEAFSHIWLTFVFHEVPPSRKPRPLVRPPRLGGNTRVGVFASRSPFRPNRLGLSLVRQEGLFRHNGDLCLAIAEIDLVDGTPVLDIKPHLPWCDSRTDATGAWAEAAPQPHLSVNYSDSARQQLETLAPDYPSLEPLIGEVLRQDPRPAYHAGRDSARTYALSLFDLDIHWRVTGSVCEVCAIRPRSPPSQV